MRGRWADRPTSGIPRRTGEGRATIEDECRLLSKAGRYVRRLVYPFRSTLSPAIDSGGGIATVRPLQRVIPSEPQAPAVRGRHPSRPRTPPYFSKSRRGVCDMAFRLFGSRSHVHGAVCRPDAPGGDLCAGSSRDRRRLDLRNGAELAGQHTARWCRSDGAQRSPTSTPKSRTTRTLSVSDRQRRFVVLPQFTVPTDREYQCHSECGT